MTSSDKVVKRKKYLGRKSSKKRVRLVCEYNEVTSRPRTAPKKVWTRGLEAI